MNYILIKEKGTNKTYQKVKNLDWEVFNIKTSDCIAYNPETKLDDEQWFVLENFSGSGFENEIVNRKWNSASYPQSGKIDVENVDHILVYQNNNEYCFQRVYKRARLLNRKVLIFKDEIRVEDSDNAILIENEPDAVYIKNEDRLFFKNIVTIAPIFPGIGKLYREATQLEVDAFINSSFINISADFKTSSIGKENRKRIALIKDSLDKMSKRDKNKLYKYTNDYFPDLGYDGKKFMVNNDSDLKKLLFGLSERCFTTPISREKKAANSVVSL